MLDDYVEAITDDGIIEIFNNQRTYEYAQALGISGVKKTQCECSAQLACEPGPYTCKLTPDDCFTQAQIDAINVCGGSVIPVTGSHPGAPFWDETVQGSYDFAGAYVLGSSGWSGGAGREVTQNALGGSSFGSYVRQGRCITYDLMLIARSQAGLEFGVSWYDSLMTSLGSCGFFTLGTAVDCPKGTSCTADQLNADRRYLRQVTTTAGIDVLSTRVTGCCKGTCGHFSSGGVYARAQITVCSENPWIYTEPDCAADKMTFDQTTAKKSFNFVPQAEQTGPVYKTQSILSARTRYKIKVGRDGKICKVGTWDWADTQYGGGTGVVVLDELLAADQATLTQRTATVTEAAECKKCQINLFYDIDEDTVAYPQGPSWFETINWEHEPGTPLPCDCDIEIVGIYTRNDAYDPNAQASVNPTANQQWILTPYSGSGDTTKSCCDISLNFDTNTSGSWSAGGAKPGGITWDPAGRDPLTNKPNFPDANCNLNIVRPCPEEEDTSALVYWDGAIDGVARLSVLGPVTYESDGSWTSFDGLSGCLPDSDCNVSGVTSNIVIPRIENSASFTNCESQSNCTVELLPDLTGATDGTWRPLGDSWFNDVAEVFPSVNCGYTLDRTQDETDILVDEQYLVSPGSCSRDGESEFSQIFPSFDSDCWDPVLIPNSNYSTNSGCYCLPLHVVQNCVAYRNDSSTYCMVPSLTIRPGAKDLKNFRIRGWVSSFSTLDSPCVNPDIWVDKTPDFSLEVPHIPTGSTLKIDGESKKANLSFPGGGSESALRYISGTQGAPFEFVELAPCETIYLLFEASDVDTADNMNIDVCFTNFYGASGGLLL